MERRPGPDHRAADRARHRASVEAALHPLSGVRLHRPFEVGDYVDFYASENHATNVGRLFRPGGEALMPNWKHLPIGYHGRSGTVVLRHPVSRPRGQRPGEGAPMFGPSQRLDFEAEVGFVVGVGSALARRSTDEFADHVFGAFLVNDWSARDIQSWESRPLGPFLAKSFATSISPWSCRSRRWRMPGSARRPGPRTAALPVRPRQWGLDLALEIQLNGQVIARPPFASMYWTPAQMLAHLTVNGASTRTGDFYASGTVSGPDREQRGCLLELSWGGAEPLVLPDGSVRSFLEDGDELTITATAPAADGTTIGFGEVTGRILPASAGGA